MKNDKNEKIIGTILYIIIIVLIIIIGYEVIKLKDREKQYKKEIETLKEQLNNEEFNEADAITSEDYYVSYSSLWLTPDTYTTLSLKSDGTFYMEINMCEGVIPLEGTYTKSNNLVTLTNLSSNFTGYAHDVEDSITFDIESDGTLKVNNDVACMFKGSIFSRK